MEKLNEIKLLREKQVSEIYNIPLPTLRNDRFHRRGLPYTRKGKSIFYRVADIEAFFKSNTICPEDGQEVINE